MELTHIVRQDSLNGIIGVSLKLRQLYKSPPTDSKAYLPVKGHQNIYMYPTVIDVVNAYVNNLQTNGYENSTLISHTNSLCTGINIYVRKALHNNPPGLVIGDLLLVTQNNLLTKLSNGDLVIVEAIGDREWRANLSFLHVRVKELVSKTSHTVLMIENILSSQSPNINVDQNKNLMIDYYYRMKDRGVTQDNPFFNDNMVRDHYLNALRATYGYALTCHKGQGGEWKEVYLYMDNKIQRLGIPGIYQWWYTAVTRAKETLHIANDWFIR